MDVSRPQNPCFRAGGSSIFTKSLFSTLSSKKVSRSVLRAPQNIPEGSLRAPGGVPRTPPEQPQAPPEAPKAADRRPGRLHRASGRRGGSILTPYGNPFWGIAGLKGRLYGECLGSPNDYGEGIQDDDGSREKTQRKPRSKPLNSRKLEESSLPASFWTSLDLKIHAPVRAGARFSQNRSCRRRARTRSPEVSPSTSERYRGVPPSARGRI